MLPLVFKPGLLCDERLWRDQSQALSDTAVLERDQADIRVSLPAALPLLNRAYKPRCVTLVQHRSSL